MKIPIAISNIPRLPKGFKLTYQCGGSSVDPSCHSYLRQTKVTYLTLQESYEKEEGEKNVTL